MAAHEIVVGKVSRIYPAKREIRIAPQAAYRQVLEQLKILDVVMTDGERLSCRVKNARWSGEEWHVVFVPGVPKDAVGRMKRARIVEETAEDGQPYEVFGADVGPTVFMPLEALEGWTVSSDGGTVGVIVRTAETKAGGILEVEKPNGGTMLLPFVEELISNIDEDGKRIVVRDLERFAVEDDEDAAD